MPPDERNGVAPQTLSSFDTDFREIRRRAPTDAETARHLTYERLARKSTLDPMTIAFIAGGIGADEVEKAAERIETAAAGQKTFGSIFEQLDRIEQRLDDLAKRQPTVSVGRSPQADGPFAGIVTVVCAFVTGAAICEAAFFALSWGWLPPVFDRVAAFVCGLSLTAGILIYLWLWPAYCKWRKAQHW